MQLDATSIEKLLLVLNPVMRDREADVMRGVCMLLPDNHGGDDDDTMDIEAAIFGPLFLSDRPTLASGLLVFFFVFGYPQQRYQTNTSPKRIWIRGPNDKKKVAVGFHMRPVSQPTTFRIVKPGLENVRQA